MRGQTIWRAARWWPVPPMRMRTKDVSLVRCLPLEGGMGVDVRVGSIFCGVQRFLVAETIDGEVRQSYKETFGIRRFSYRRRRCMSVSGVPPLIDSRFRLWLSSGMCRGDR
jgi:hypothetical protein